MQAVLCNSDLMIEILVHVEHRFQITVVVAPLVCKDWKTACDWIRRFRLDDRNRLFSHLSIVAFQRRCIDMRDFFARFHDYCAPHRAYFAKTLEVLGTPLLEPLIDMAFQLQPPLFFNMPHHQIIFVSGLRSILAARLKSQRHRRLVLPAWYLMNPYDPLHASLA
jgi:hypothetical protein